MRNDGNSKIPNCTDSTASVKTKIFKGDQLWQIIKLFR